MSEQQRLGKCHTGGQRTISCQSLQTSYHGQKVYERRPFFLWRTGILSSVADLSGQWFDRSGMIHAKAVVAPGSKEAAIFVAAAGGKDETILSSGEHHDHGSMAGLCQYVGETRTRHHTCNRSGILPKVRRVARDLEDDQNADSVFRCCEKRTKNALKVAVDRGLCRISKVEAGVLNIGDAQ